MLYATFFKCFIYANLYSKIPLCFLTTPKDTQMPLHESGTELTLQLVRGQIRTYLTDYSIAVLQDGKLWCAISEYAVKNTEGGNGATFDSSKANLRVMAVSDFNDFDGRV